MAPGASARCERPPSWLTQDEAFRLMDPAWESGIVHYDTADAYGGGRSEQAIGRWIRSRGVRPRLTTKTFNPMQAGADHGLRPDRIARQLRSAYTGPSPSRAASSRSTSSGVL